VCSFGGECDVDIKVAGVTDDRFASVEVASRVDGWDAEGSDPYECHFTLRRDDYADLHVRVSVAPHGYDMADGTGLRTERDGTEIFFDPRGCAASTFVGPPMERKGAKLFS
jgi:hypothetical protein